MRRRDFLATLGGAILAPFAARSADQVVVGILWPSTEQIDANFLAAFRDGLKKEGYVEGENLELANRYADGDFGRLPALAAELVALRPRVVVTASSPGMDAVRSLSPTLPLVGLLGFDPVAQGYAKSLSRPDGMLTGVKVAVEIGPMVGKRVAVLKEAVTNLARLAILFDPRVPSDIEVLKGVDSAADHLGFSVTECPVRSSHEVEAAFRSGIVAKAQAFFISPTMFSYHAQIIASAERARRPTISQTPEFVRDGLLMSYGVDFLDLWRQMPPYVARILNGAKPGDLPIGQPSKFYLTINLKTAKSLGLAIPPTLLARADEVIE